MLVLLLLLWLLSLLLPNTPLKWEESLHLHFSCLKPDCKVEGICSQSMLVPFKPFGQDSQ